MPLSILHLLAPGTVGGLERVVQALAIGQRGDGHAVMVLAVVADAASAMPFRSVLDRAGVRLRMLHIPARGYHQERAAVRALCQEFRPDVLHTHGYRPDVTDGGVARRLGIATVSTVHGFTGGGWRNRLYERLQARALRRFSGVVAVSAPVAHRLASEGVPPDRIHVVRNAWWPDPEPLDRDAARRLLGVAPDHFLVGWVGRISREKGPDLMIPVSRYLLNLPVRVAMLGEGGERQRLTDLSQRSGVADRLHWHGAIDQASRLFSAFDVFVLSSRTEGTPLVLFEAMAAGTPIVATAVGGVPDVVSSAEALVVPPESPDAIAAAIHEVYTRKDQAHARAWRARRRLEVEFTVGPWLERYEALYRRLRSAATHGSEP